VIVKNLGLKNSTVHAPDRTGLALPDQLQRFMRRKRRLDYTNEFPQSLADEVLTDSSTRDQKPSQAAVYHEGFHTRQMVK
jgi:hypothetical protein